MRRSHLALLGVGILITAAGCGEGDDEPAGERSGGQAAEQKVDQSRPVVDMTDALTFDPPRVTVSVGERVVWRNVGRVAHTVTTLRSKAANPGNASVPSGAEAWDSGFIQGGKSYERRFTKPGTYRYFCIPHENARMVGTVVVER